MLKNILKSNVDKSTQKDISICEVVYNQKPITVKPGEFLDVRDFGIPAELIVPVERHIMLKHPGVFKQSKTDDVFKTSKESLQKIAELEELVEELKNNLEEARSALKESEEKEAAVKTENDGLASQVKSLKEEVKSLKAKDKASK